MKYSVAVNNARLDITETTIGPNAILRIRSGAEPANCAAADSGTVLATLNLPADWMAAAAGGVKSKSGTWEDLLADATGVAGHYRIYESSGTVCHEQGSVATSGADMNLSTTSITAGVPFTVTSYSKTAGNA
jgi:hypothetical protein